MKKLTSTIFTIALFAGAAMAQKGPKQLEQRHHTYDYEYLNVSHQNTGFQGDQHFENPFNRSYNSRPSLKTGNTTPVSPRLPSKTKAVNARNSYINRAY